MSKREREREGGDRLSRAFSRATNYACRNPQNDQQRVSSSARIQAFFSIGMRGLLKERALGQECCLRTSSPFLSASFFPFRNIGELAPLLLLFLLSGNEPVVL